MKKIHLSATAFLTFATSVAQINLASFDFNGSSALPLAASTNTTNITASMNGTQANAAFSGTATGAGAFFQNTTAGNALSMSNSSGTNTNYWTLTLGGSDLNKYMNYKIYFQSEHSNTGATGIAILYSTDGNTYTALSQTISPGLNTTYSEASVDLSGISALNNQAAVYIRFAANGGTGSTGTLRMDNLQIQAALSPWTMSNGNVNFTGGISATSFTTTGNARVNGSLTVSGLTAASNGLSVTAPTVFSATLKNTSFTGTGNRLLLTDATGLISPLSAGTSSQVLSGTGMWVSLPAQPFTSSGSNAYFTGGNLGIGKNNPQVPLDVVGNAKIAGNLDASSISFGGSLANMGFIPASANTNSVNIAYLSKGTGPNTVLPVNTCNFPMANQWAYQVAFDQMQITGSSGNNTNALSLGVGTGGGMIDLAGQFQNTNTDRLLINYNCGKDVYICTNYGSGNGSGIGSNGNGGVVSLGFNVNIGAPYPADNSIALNLKAHGATALNVQDNNNNGIFNVAANGNVTMLNTGQLLFGPDGNHGLAAYSIDGSNTQFAGRSINGPVLFGYQGGALGSTNNGQKIVLQWNDLGQVFIGSTRPNSNNNHGTLALNVGGNGINTTALYVTDPNAKWSDFVFESTYCLMPLNELEAFYKQKHHLPNVPSTQEIQEQGNNLAETDAVLLQKVEELTLYLVQQQKALEQQQQEIAELKKRLNSKP